MMSVSNNDRVSLRLLFNDFGLGCVLATGCVLGLSPLCFGPHRQKFPATTLPVYICLFKVNEVISECWVYYFRDAVKIERASSFKQLVMAALQRGLTDY